MIIITLSQFLLGVQQLHGVHPSSGEPHSVSMHSVQSVPVMFGLHIHTPVRLSHIDVPLREHVHSSVNN